MFDTTQTISRAMLIPDAGPYAWGDLSYAVMEVESVPTDHLDMFEGLEHNKIITIGGFHFALSAAHMPTLMESMEILPSKVGDRFGPQVAINAVASAILIKEIIDYNDNSRAWGLGFSPQGDFSSFIPIRAHHGRDEVLNDMDGLIKQFKHGVFANLIAWGDKVPVFEIEPGVQLLAVDNAPSVQMWGPFEPSPN